MENENNVPFVSLQEVEIFQPEFLNLYSEEDLEDMDMQLSEKEEGILKEILEIENAQNCEPNLMAKLLEAVKKGTLDYLDSMTDTGDTFSSMKRSDTVRRWDDVEIAPINQSANKVDAEVSRTRTIADANKSALRNAEISVDGMTEKGKVQFKKFEAAYNQRTKSLNQLSTKTNSIKRSDQNVNMDTLSGLRGYRLGPVVEMPSLEKVKRDYEESKTTENPSCWLKTKNINDFDTKLATSTEDGGLGWFNSVKDASEWRTKNKLTVHEGPDGMFLIPSDVHEAARHDGYRSIVSKYIMGEKSETEIKSYIKQEQIAFVKHEAKERGTRMIKGIGMSAMKDLLKCGIVVVVDETVIEFKEQSEDKFVTRMWRILKKTWQHLKNKCREIIANLWKNIKGSILNEFLTLLNDFFFKTFKNVFKVVRQMFSSIKSAFKIIFSKDSSISLEERIFEAAKVLSAGVASLIGFSLNELIEKGLTSIGIPFASFIAECLSGLFSGILSAIVLMLFDTLKSKFLATSPAVQKMQLQANAITVKYARVSISSLKVDMKMLETYNLFSDVIISIAETRRDILLQRMIAAGLHSDIKKEIERKKIQGRTSKEMIQKYEQEDF